MLMSSSVILIIPFGIAVIYFFVSLRQLFIGSKENSSWKFKGGIKPFVISTITIVTIILVWLYVWVV